LESFRFEFSRADKLFGISAPPGGIVSVASNADPRRGYDSRYFRFYYRYGNHDL
jgi:hypothetical protein